MISVLAGKTEGFVVTPVTSGIITGGGNLIFFVVGMCRWEV